MTAHTRGPWSVCGAIDDPCPCGLVWDSSDEIAVAEVFGPVVLKMDNPPCDVAVSRDEQIANARLIAAAPCLLAACKAALNDRMHKDWPAVADLLITAIAKAEGPAPEPDLDEIAHQQRYPSDLAGERVAERAKGDAR